MMHATDNIHSGFKLRLYPVMDYKQIPVTDAMYNMLCSTQCCLLNRNTSLYAHELSFLFVVCGYYTYVQ